MKKGDKFAVVLGAHEVAEATLVEIDGDQAILEIPATRIVMGIHSSLGDLAADPNAKERMILGMQEEDPVAAEYRRQGIELDEDYDDLHVQASSNRTGPTAPETSLKDMDLDGID